MQFPNDSFYEPKSSFFTDKTLDDTRSRCCVKLTCFLQDNKRGRAGQGASPGAHIYTLRCHSTGGREKALKIVKREGFSLLLQCRTVKSHFSWRVTRMEGDVAPSVARPLPGYKLHISSPAQVRGGSKRPGLCSGSQGTLHQVTTSGDSKPLVSRTKHQFNHRKR